MFTPQGKGWSGWSLGKNGGLESTSGPNSNHGSGKAAAFVDSTPENGVLGFQDLPVDHESMVKKLKNELVEYQYNMGLLLIEKKEWTSKYEELKQSLDEANDILRREQAAHLIAMSEIEKREENMRKALGVEKQCVTDLEKALHEMRSQYAEIKFVADSKLAEANALVSSIEEKSLEVELKLHAADAKIAEINRKTAEMERKSQEVEALESALRRDRLSFSTEREAHESNLSKQREDLRGWEKKLQEREEGLAEVRRLLNQREERANENDMLYQKKQEDLNQVQKKINLTNDTLKKKEEDIDSRVANLAVKEKEAEAMKNCLEVKEKELLALEEKLDTRERVEVQKLLDEHRRNLDAKKQTFELELEQKRIVFDEELKNKAVDVERREAEINHMEEKLAKREQTYEKKLEKFKEKEKDLEAKSKALKEKEKSVKAEEKNLGNEKKQMLVDKEEMLKLNAELEKLRAETEEKQMKIKEETEQLVITKEERSEYVRLQSELKMEIDKCQQQGVLLLRDGEELKQEREKFEKEWEEMDEKKAELVKEVEEMTKQREKFEKLKKTELENLEKEKRSTNEYVHREMETLKVAKDSFAATMEHEKAVMAEQIQSEKTKLVNDFELQKRELEIEMRKRQEEMDSSIGEREKKFDEERERELKNISYSREIATREREELKIERLRIEKEKEDIAINQNHLEGQQLEMRKDIDELVSLSIKLKAQREQFIKERERFIAFAEKQKSCETCGELTSAFVVSELQSLPEMDDVEVLPLPTLKGDYLGAAAFNTRTSSYRENNGLTPRVVNSASPVSGGTISWLKKCTTKLFSISPGKRDELTSSHDGANDNSKVVTEEPALVGMLSNEDSFATNLSDSQKFQSEKEPSTQEIAEDSPTSGLKLNKEKPGGSRRIRVTRSMRAVVADAKSIIGEQNGHSERSTHKNNVEVHEEPSLVEKGKQKNTRKRGRLQSSQNMVSEQHLDHSEGHSGSFTTGGRKRRQRVAQVGKAPAEKRYNLRPNKHLAKDVTNGDLSDLSKSKEGVVDDGIGGTKGTASNAKATGALSTEIASENGGSTNSVEYEAAADGMHGNADASSKLADDMVPSEKEVNVTPIRQSEAGSDEVTVNDGDDDDDDEDDDEEESEHPGEVSIGKKFWNFLTT